MPHRWTPARKLEVVLAHRRARDARARLRILRDHGLSDEEMRDWDRRFTRYGEDGLKEKSIRAFRSSED